MGNGQGIERRIHDEATNYEGDLFFCSLGAGGCFGRREQHDEERHRKPERGSNEWEREHGLVQPPKSCSSSGKTDPMKSPCLLSFSVTNCFGLKRQEDRDLDDEDHRGRGNESIFSCGCARIGCLTPSWLNPQPANGDDEETDDERQRRDQQVETSINILKARQAEQALVRKVKAKREKKKKPASNDVVEISAPHLETFRRTTDEFISAHLAMCPDPRARVAKYDNNEDAGSAVRVVSLEASAPPPPSTDGPAPYSLRPLPPTPAADARGRLPAPALPAPNHLPPPPLPPATSSK